MQDIKGYGTFTKIEVINKGWSEDKKYYVETEDGGRLLLRISDITKYDQKKKEFVLVKQLAAMDLPISQAVDFGICDNGKSVYSILSWCDGEDAETVLPYLTETEQYILGIRSGEILKKIHSIPAPEEQEEWGNRFNRKTDIKIEKYRACEIQFHGDDKIIGYIESNRHLLFGRPQCFQHGDYHTGNMVISQDHTLHIIDFNRYDYGDPWEEFNRIVWSEAVSPHFATGQLEGYFGGKPPAEFFRLLAFYIASNTLSSIYWAIPFGQSEIEIMIKQSQELLGWIENKNNPVPDWYLKDFYIQSIDNVSYKLRAPYDMSFISQ